MHWYIYLAEVGRTYGSLYLSQQRKIKIEKLKQRQGVRNK